MAKNKKMGNTMEFVKEKKINNNEPISKVDEITEVAPIEEVFTNDVVAEEPLEIKDIEKVEVKVVEPIKKVETPIKEKKFKFVTVETDCGLSVKKVEY